MLSSAPAEWFDLYDPRLKTDPYPIYARLLAEQPFFTTVDGVRSAIYSRYDDVEEIYGDPELFSSVKPALPNMAKVDYSGGQLNIAFSDPPVHTRLRRTLNPAFVPRSVAQLVPGVEAAVATLLDTIADEDEIDVMSALARPLSQGVMLGELMNIPPADQPLFLEFATVMFEAGDRAPGSPLHQRFDALRCEAEVYCHALIEREQASPTEGVMGAFLARSASGALSDAEVLALMMTLLTGGFSTIASLIGSTFLNIAGRPDQLSLLVSNPDLAPQAVEEVARNRAPGLFNFRFPTREADVAGLRLEPGMPVYLLQGATSFDPAHFNDPFRFDITREPKRLLVFGHGIHHCVGAPVARLATRTLLREAVRRFPRMALAQRMEDAVFTGQPQELSPVIVPLRLGREAG